MLQTPPRDTPIRVDGHSHSPSQVTKLTIPHFTFMTTYPFLPIFHGLHA